MSQKFAIPTEYFPFDVRQRAEKVLASAEISLCYQDLHVAIFRINKEEIRLQLTADLQFSFINSSCTCDNFALDQQCAHLYAAATSYKHQQDALYKLSSNAQSKNLSGSQMIRQTSQAELQYFLKGLLQHHRQVKMIARMLLYPLTVDLVDPLRIEKNIKEWHQSFKKDLKSKRLRKSFSFYLSSLLGLAEDLFAEKAYQKATLTAIGLWKYVIAHQELIHEKLISDQFIERLIQFLAECLHADLPPALYQSIQQLIESQVVQHDYIPLQYPSMPELLQDSTCWTSDQYTQWLSYRKTQCHISAYAFRFLYHFEPLDFETKQKLKTYFCCLRYGELVELLHPDYKLDSHLLLQIISQPHWTVPQLQKLKAKLSPTNQLFLDVELWHRTADVSLGKYVIKALQESPQSASFRHHIKEIHPGWISDILDNLDASSSSINDIDLLVRIRLIPYLNQVDREKVRQSIVQSILTFIATHFGASSTQTLQEWKWELHKVKQGDLWVEIHERIQNKYADRKSLQSLLS